MGPLTLDPHGRFLGLIDVQMDILSCGCGVVGVDRVVGVFF